MRKLNPHLRRKKLTIQEAIQKGMKKNVPISYSHLTVFMAALEGVGIRLDKVRQGQLPL